MSTEEEYDGWGLSEGGSLGTGTVTINAASFGYDAQYKNGEQELAIIEGLVVNEDGEEHDWRQFFSIGAGWSIVDGGTRVERVNGKKANFQKQSKYGLWIAGALDSGAAEVLRGRGPATNAKVWASLIFEVGSREQDYGGDIGKKPVLVPVKYLGEKGSATASTASAATPASSEAPASGEVPGALKAKLKRLAAEHDTHDAFVDAAFLIDGVDGNKHVESLVADSPDFYNALRG